MSSELLPLTRQLHKIAVKAEHAQVSLAHRISHYTVDRQSEPSATQMPSYVYMPHHRCWSAAVTQGSKVRQHDVCTSQGTQKCWIEAQQALGHGGRKCRSEAKGTAAYLHSVMLKLMRYGQDSRMLVLRKAISGGGGSRRCLRSTTREICGQSVCRCGRGNNDDAQLRSDFLNLCESSSAISGHNLLLRQYGTQQLWYSGKSIAHICFRSE